ncbi:MAG TPA: translation initiation factor IF-3 [Candidatus Paceibacterota bacterium]|nr:translation initiation factor IF-3 [Candidatus Paceibacterota bacterium]
MGSNPTISTSQIISIDNQDNKIDITKLNKQKKIQPTFKVNEAIKADKIRLLDDTGKNLGIFQIEEAKKLAQDKNLDLVEISQADLPIVKLINFSKFKYQQQKIQQKNKGGKKEELKTIKIRTSSQIHDLETKAKQIDKFLQEEINVQIIIFFKGRRDLRREELLTKKLEELLSLLKTNYKIINQRKTASNLMVLISKA